MDKRKFKEKKRKAVEIVEINIIKIQYLNVNYELELYPHALVNRENGLLECGKLKSNKNIFRFRWDEKDESIDVDLQLAGTKKRLKDFIGHHTIQVSVSPNRKYKFKIKHKDELVFKAVIEVVVKTENRIAKNLRYVIKGEVNNWRI